MRTFKAFQSFRTEEDKTRWLNRREMFSRALPYFTTKQRAIAILLFDADKTGIAIKINPLKRLLGIRYFSIIGFVNSMDRICTKLKAEKKI